MGFYGFLHIHWRAGCTLLRAIVLCGALYITIITTTGPCFSVESALGSHEATEKRKV